MSFTSRMKAASNNLLPERSGRGMEGVGFSGFLVDKGERYGAALGYGYLKGKYREKMVYKDYGIDLWSGAALTIGSALLNIMSGGNSLLAPHLARVGDAGVSSYLNSIGTAMGAKAAGRSFMMLDAAGKKLPALAATTGVYGTSVLGSIAPARGGTYLSADEIAHFSSPR